LSTQRKAIQAICARQDGAELEYPFGPETAVYKTVGKIFAVVGADRSPLQLTLKCDPEHGEALRGEHAAITPGYHMNKRHWITIALDGSVPQALVAELIEDSFDLVAPRRRQA
jgi:predicted DNA-binding protein (MmcQ/YjbR family)